MEYIKTTEIQGMWSYIKSIDWTEDWLKGLIAFHILCLVLTVLSRNNSTAQAIYFVFLLLAVYSAEYINEWAAKNYRLFSRQQYFDSNGMFISILYSLPILFNCLAIVILWLRNAVFLLTEVKRMKIKKSLAAQNKKKE